MSWYSRPIQPIDPIVVSGQPKPSFRYVRDNFAGTGQNSHDIPPTQDQAMWQALTNVQPITKGVLERRWGYTQFAGFGAFTNRLYSYQSDALGTRAILTTGPFGVSANTESGASYNSAVFAALSGAVIRSVTSRNYQYFCNGNIALSNHRTGDSLKWNGSATNFAGVSNIGIVNTDVTINNVGGGSSGNTVGPNTGTTGATNGTGNPPAWAWSNAGGQFANNFVSPASVTTAWGGANGTRTTNNLSATGFFNSAPGSGVAGIHVTYTMQYSAGGTGGVPTYNLTAQLLKNNIPVGTPKTLTNVFTGFQNTPTTFNFGGSNDTWGATLSPNDIVQPGFGVQIYLTGSIFAGTNATETFQVGYVQCTATLTGTSGGATTSGTGVGVVSAQAGGSVSLTIGRIYYLVGNNSSTGHFSDLSNASASTGSVQNSEFDLVLATYNDPQVDTKYLLATADGGDPSILYEVQCLIPGLTVTSWNLAANVVTFTGTYTGSPPANSSTVTLGGFSHGSYFNGQTVTVTSTTGTTLVASFTHANDSATEFGIVGTPGFAIPNSVTQVVDNNSDPNLVTNQPLVYTDQFGTTYGLALNTPPPAGNLLIKHQGRLWMAGVSGSTHSVYFSKSIAELTLPNSFIAGKYEECWPGSNYFDISDGAESVTGFLTDGSTLYIGTQSHIRRLVGNAPANFQLPQIVHPAAGLINQEVWQLVFNQGAPSGCCWLTPDFRVIQSDFNTYVDIGGPIQNILNSIQPQAQTLAHASFVSSGEYALYILSVPLNSTTQCDTHLVFDLKNRQWFVWKPTSGSLALLFNINAAGTPQWIFINGAGLAMNIYGSAFATDAGMAIPVTATTSWLHLGEPTRRKMLTEIEIFGNLGTTVTLFGGNNLQDMIGSSIDPANAIVYNRSLVQSPFGPYKTYLTGEECKHRYYQFTFTANNTTPVFLSAYNVLTVPMDDV